jgi:superfamily I DNA/RNA helicase
MATRWSGQQQAIFNWFGTGSGNLVVEALAGTGKTTTILEAITRAPEQNILLGAFNKRIETELTSRLTNPNAIAKTFHGLGFAQVKRYWEKIGVDTRGARATSLAERVCGTQAPDALKRLVAKAHTKAREITPLATCPEDLVALVVQFDCVPDDQWKSDGFDVAWVASRAFAALQLAATEKPIATGIDFADMIFLPIKNRWLRPTYDLVVVDEAQDMTVSQLLLAQGVCSGRIAIVGDSHQAIYGFRGADSGALDRLRVELQAATLQLTTTYRCGKAIVTTAQRYVPAFEAGPANSDGVISAVPRAELTTAVRPGDFVLSRTNAPLVSSALALIRLGVRVKIEGRDIGAGLKAIVTKLAKGPAANSIPKWLEKLGTWRDRETERAAKAKLDSKAEQILDQYETLLALSDGVSGIPELLARLDTLFADTEGAPAHVVCSSVHKAKGLEASRVFVLEWTLHPPVPCQTCRKRPKGCQCPAYVPDPRQAQEEANIAYVAITRAKDELTWVSK